MTTAEKVDKVFKTQDQVSKDVAETPKSAPPMTLKEIGVNQLSNSIETLEVKEHTVPAYFKQIANNFYVGAKAVWYVCRDIKLASDKLPNSEFEELMNNLQSTLGISKSLVSKYKQIAENKVLLRMFNNNKLPLSYTNMYLITTLDSDQQVAVEESSEITPSSTADDIKRVAGVEVKTITPKYQFDIDNADEFIKIVFDREVADANMMTLLEQKISEAIDEVNATERKYSVSKDDTGFSKFAYAVKIHNTENNVGVIENVETKNINYFEKVKKKTKDSQYAELFSGFRNELNGTALA